MQSYRTNDLKSRADITIDGHKYVVRKMGNLENLEYSRYIRKLEKLAEIEKVRPLNDDEDAILDKISYEMAELFIGLFDDGGDQTKSRRLIKSLSEEDINKYILKAFNEEEPKQPEKAKSTTEKSKST